MGISRNTYSISSFNNSFHIFCVLQVCNNHQLNLDLSSSMYFIIICREKLEAFLLRSMEGGLISDGVVAQDINQASSFWRIREVPSCDLNIFS